ncbi:helix-turn-helix transcriptional regulator [Roseomonas sp. GC11]|uniref:helix-turn-helix domain-containing protein n=1 Tax=Roseomonas sp. GC11 TaxID=2950546 RepID=UPI00210E5E70|nr:helix-turn-helix transcriptional regulator [Roseomonas sp. GC11]MCQ4160834.1 helix-turn-helix transcriptional regulator [Roseomonas sp. GC11]
MSATPVYHSSEPLADFDASAGYPPDSIKAEVGRRIAERLRTKGWNQSDLAREAGIGRDNVSTYVRGKSLPGPKILAAIAKALDCTAEDLAPGIHGATAAGRPGGAALAAPPLEIRQVSDSSGEVWVRMHRRMSLEQAMRIMAILAETAVTSGADGSGLVTGGRLPAPPANTER